MSIKIFASNADRQEVARKLLDAAPDPTHVRVEKMGGFGYIISDELAKKLGLSGDEATPDDLNDKESDEESSSDKPKRGRPRGKKSKGE